MTSILPNDSVFKCLNQHKRDIAAIVHSQSGRVFTYGSLLHDVAAAKDHLAEVTSGRSLAGERIAFLAENGYDYVVTFLSILAHDAIALPLAQGFPSHEIQYILENSGASILISTTKFEEKAKDVLSLDFSPKPQLEILDKIEGGNKSITSIQFEEKDLKDGGFMLYTSGTTSRPKGVVLTTKTITAQANSLIEAWNYTQDDRLLHVLPLHHIHGTVNALFTPLIAGATIEFAYPFVVDQVWKRFAAPFLGRQNGNISGTTNGGTNGTSHNDTRHARSSSIDMTQYQRPITFFTVVPTIYSRLLNEFPSLDEQTQKAAREAINPKNLRLNISGSMALPTPIKAAWTELSGGNVLLERYGMTEVGMALSCGLDFEDRVDGSVGWPLPGVEVRLVDTDTNEVIKEGEEKSADGKLREGEIQLRGPSCFTEYWNNPKATAAEFVEDENGGQKWFKTGDVASRVEIPNSGRSNQAWAKGPMYFIKGRKSVDIIKTGGEKVSALEVERELLSLPQVSEAAVVGVPSEKWGQKVAAVVVLTEMGKTAGKDGKRWSPLDMRKAMKELLITYKVPQELKVVDTIPRNAMGKINKKTLVKELWPESQQTVPQPNY